MDLRAIARLAPEELRARRARGEALLPLDVRTIDARSVHPYEIPGSRWLPLAQVVELADELPRDVSIVAYCT
jgi:rhodanese-related sulfurtransferase